VIRTPPRIHQVDGTVRAPPSKSYTHRALITGALGSGTTILEHPLDAEDTRLTAQALTALGVPLHWQGDRIIITGGNGILPTSGTTTLNLDNSGTSLRLLTSLALLASHPVVLTGSARMQGRPIGPLADALVQIGGHVTFTGKKGFPPVQVSGHLNGGAVSIDGSMSSQYISSLLLAAPYADKETELEIIGTAASRSYLDITVDVMRTFGADVKQFGSDRFVVSNCARYAGRTCQIEGDYSSASYFFAIAAICGGKITVTNLNATSVQGDRQFLTALEAMGCRVTCSGDAVTIERTGSLRGITIDMSSSPDTVQTLCMVAAVADTPTTITGISHLKFKESDRITSTAEHLMKLGGNVQVEDDRITISPRPLHGGTIDPGNDHRTAMSFAALGLGIGEVTITGAECVNKSFPGFWETLAEVVQ
jgi:3-phosphoshikimate 1-carboxyvinyltransferase